MVEIVKVGVKGRHVSIPAGFVRVVDGLCVEGDLFYDLHNLRFVSVESDDVGMPWDSFDLLVRSVKKAS